MSFSPGGDSQPEITGSGGGSCSSWCRRAEGLPGSDLNFNTFPITAVWAGKITRGKQAMCFSCFSGHQLGSPHQGPQAWFVLSPGLEGLDKPQPGRHRRNPGFPGWWFSRPGNPHYPYSLLWSPVDIFGNCLMVQEGLSVY